MSDDTDTAAPKSEFWGDYVETCPVCDAEQTGATFTTHFSGPRSTSTSRRFACGGYHDYGEHNEMLGGYCPKRGQAKQPSMGCICPPTSEQTCQNAICPRRACPRWELYTCLTQ